MSSKLRIISFNCQSYNNKKVIIDKLLQKCDIICLQETFTTDGNKNVYDSIDPNFVGDFIPAVRKCGHQDWPCFGGVP